MADRSLFSRSHNRRQVDGSGVPAVRGCRGRGIHIWHLLILLVVVVVVSASVLVVLVFVVLVVVLYESVTFGTVSPHPHSSAIVISKSIVFMVISFVFIFPA